MNVPTGFVAPTTTDVPDEFLDVWAHRLSNSQVRVFLVICRHTLGHKQRTAAISINEMAALSGGHRSTVCRAVNQLEKLGFIERERSGERAPTTTLYSVRFDPEGSRAHATGVVAPASQPLTTSRGARSSSSEVCSTPDSKALIDSTSGAIRLISRACLVPKTFVKRLSIMTLGGGKLALRKLFLL